MTTKEKRRYKVTRVFKLEVEATNIHEAHDVASEVDMMNWTLDFEGAERL